MSNIYFTVTGLNHYYGDSFLEKEMIVYGLTDTLVTC
jgi:hypothetical protein